MLRRRLPFILYNLVCNYYLLKKAQEMLKNRSTEIYKAHMKDMEMTISNWIRTTTHMLGEKEISVASLDHFYTR